MIDKNTKETEFSIQFLHITLKLDDILILLILYLLHSEAAENTSLLMVLVLLFLS